MCILVTGGTVLHTTDDDVLGIRNKEDIIPWLAAMPELPLIAPVVDVHLFLRQSNEQSVFDHWTDVAQFICENQLTYAGYVILAEVEVVCYFAQALQAMLENVDVPVVFTGSQLPDHLLDNRLGLSEILSRSEDVGLRANLINAFQIINNRIKGVGIMFGDKYLSPTRLSFKQVFLAVPFRFSKDHVLGDVEFSIKPTAVYEKRLKQLEGKKMALNTALERQIGYFEVTPLLDERVVMSSMQYYKGVVLYVPGVLSYPRALIEFLMKRDNDVPIMICGRFAEYIKDKKVRHYNEQLAKHHIVIARESSREHAVVLLMNALGQAESFAQLSQLISP